MAEEFAPQAVTSTPTAVAIAQPAPLGRDTGPPAPDAWQPPPVAVRVRRSLTFRNISAIYIFAALFLIFSLWVPSTFLTGSEWRSLISEQSLTCLAAVGLVLPIAAGVIDLAIGSEVGIGAILVAWLLINQHVAIPIAIVLTLVAGALMGIITWLLVVKVRINSFIATLGMSSVLLGAIEWISGGQQIINLPVSFQNIATDQIFGLDDPVYIMLIVAVLVWYVLERTAVGRRIYATGGNLESARLTGIRTSRVILFATVTSGVIAAGAGLLQSSQLATGDPTIGPPYLLPTIAAVFSRLHPVPRRPIQRLGHRARHLRPGHRRRRTAARGRTDMDSRRLRRRRAAVRSRAGRLAALAHGAHSCHPPSASRHPRVRRRTSSTPTRGEIMNLKGNTVLVTGGGRGIGRGLAEMFHAAGSRVIIAGRDQARLAEVQRGHDGIETMALDLSDAASTSRFAAEVIERHPDLNVVVHNAGLTHQETVGDGDIPLAEEIITVNLLGPFASTRALVGTLRRQPQSVIITVSSGLAFLPRFFQPTYCASKAAIHSYTQSLRYQLKDTPVRVLELIPPYVQTELSGPQQASDPNAMPLAAFIAEAAELLGTEPTPDEICVERVRMEREAEASGDYDALFRQIQRLHGRPDERSARWQWHESR